MNYVLIGMLFAIGWFAIRTVYMVIEEIIFCKLHRSNWYAIMCGKKIVKEEKKQKSTKIGF